MTIKSHNITALCAVALICATSSFAQEEDSLQQETIQQDVQESPQQEDQQEPLQQEAQQNPQQPVYYAVPKPTGNVQYIVMPAQNQQPQQTYVVNPQQQPQVIPPAPKKESSLSLFMGLGVNFYISTMSFEEDDEYSYESDYEAQHDFDGKGFNIEGNIGFLIKDFLGFRGFFGIGEQSGESSFSGSNIRCNMSNNCELEADTDLLQILLGVSATLFPFNKRDNPMYNAYIEGAFGVSIQSYDGDYIKQMERDGSATILMKFEVGKLFRISQTLNAGFGVAYSLDISAEAYHDSYEDTYYSEIKHSFWVGVRFVRKKNSF